MEDIRRNFRGIRAVYGEEGFEALQAAEVMIVGIGGVGSWLAEALCRSAVGSLVLIDSDRIELTNVNRQSHTTSKTGGLLKTEVLGERLKEINPDLKLRTLALRLSPENIDEVMADAPLYVGEAIDDVEAKAHLCSYLYKHHHEFIVSGGAGGRTDPRRLALGDLSQAKGDALIARLRYLLRRDYDFPKGGEFMNIPCTYSSEKPVYSPKDSYVSGDLPAFGACMTVTASAGLLMASWLMRRIVARD